MHLLETASILETKYLWVQQAVRTGTVDLRKVLGEVNPADLFTKHSLTREKMMGLTKLFDIDIDKLSFALDFY